MKTLHDIIRWFEKNHSYLLSFTTILLAIFTIYFTLQDTNIRQEQFELQMRPYMIIDSITPNYQNINGTLHSEYVISIRNIGNVPGDIKTISYVYMIGKKVIKENNHDYPNGIILGKDRNTIVKIIIDDIQNQKENVTIIVDYEPAITSFSKHYQTTGTFEHSFGINELKIEGNYMK